jgi:hypothetical protein
VLDENQQSPYFEIDPRNPPFCVLQAPIVNVVASGTIPINITFTNGAPAGPLQLVGANGTVIAAQINGPDPVRIDAPAGTLYAIETADHKFTHPFKHDGPEPTNVEL